MCYQHPRLMDLLNKRFLSYFLLHEKPPKMSGNGFSRLLSRVSCNKFSPFLHLASLNVDFHATRRQSETFDNFDSGANL